MLLIAKYGDFKPSAIALYLSETMKGSTQDDSLYLRLSMEPEDYGAKKKKESEIKSQSTNDSSTIKSSNNTSN